MGLIVPSSSLGDGRWYPHPFDNWSNGYVRVDNILSFERKLGVRLGFDDESGVAFWPAYASGLDDMLLRALVQGYMANVGTTPVPITLLATIVTKIQSMVGTWIMTVRGRTSPVKKTLDLMARAQDSQFGSANFVRLYMGALLVENRGAMGAQVPIEAIPFDNWSQYGMTAEPISGQKGEKNQYVLRMTTEDFRENQGLYMIDGLHCWPTGNPEYPYWFRTYSGEKQRDVWVLIHRDYGWQIFSEAGGQNTLYPGFGQSGAWRFSPYAVKHMAIDRQDWEHLINQPARGVVWVSGLDTPTQFRDQMVTYEEERREQQMFFYPGVFFGGSRGENSKISMIPWSEPPAGYTAEGWRTEWVDNLAAAFHLNVTHLEVRLGEGAMTQSDIASSLEAETAVAAMKERIEALFNHVSPPRVLVSVVWQTDRLKRYQVESFRELSLGISRVQNVMTTTVNEEGETESQMEQTFTVQEIRGLFEEYIGIDIPVLEDDERIEDDKKTGDEVGEEMLLVHKYYGMSVAAVLAADSVSMMEDGEVDYNDFKPGRPVQMTHTGEFAVIETWTPGEEWVWVTTATGYRMLVDANHLTSITFKPVVRQGFEPEGEPLDPVLELELDPDEAMADARDVWVEIADEEVEDLI